MLKISLETGVPWTMWVCMDQRFEVWASEKYGLAFCDMLCMLILHRDGLWAIFWFWFGLH